jgi:PPOX class probable F420-dependent enzyme
MGAGAHVSRKEEAMAENVGGVALLADPLAQELLAAPIPARLAYTARDGTPRVVPIWFQWTGSELVMASLPGAPKVAAMQARSDVAVTIDTDAWPYKALMIRGKARVDRHTGVVPEFTQAARRYLGDQGGDGFLAQYRTWVRDHSWRIAVRPERVTLIDFGAGRVPQNIPR